MKKLLIALFLLLSFAGPCLAKDYWVYIRLEDRSGVTQSDDAGRSKAGDVVAILEDTPQYQPSETEKKAYQIIKVSDIDEKTKADLLTPWIEKEPQIVDGKLQDVDVPKAYRKNKIDLDKLGVSKTKGLKSGKINLDKVSPKVKTSDDLVRYEYKRQIYLAYRPVQKFFDYWVKPAFASTVVSTINKTDENYNTLTLWEDDKDGDLVTATTIQEADCYDDDGTLDDKFTIDGSTTSTSYYMDITAPEGERHPGKMPSGSAGGGFKLANTTTAGNTITVSDHNVRISWIAIAPNAGRAISEGVNYLTAIYLHHLVIYAPGAVYGIFMTNPRNSYYIYDNIVYGNGTATGVGIGKFDGNDASTYLYIYNNTVDNFANNYEFNAATGTKDFSNNVSSTALTKDIINANYLESGTNNICSAAVENSSCTTAPLANGIDSSTSYTSYFLDYANKDFHIKNASSILYNGGSALAAAYETDIDNDARPTYTSWDVGADEYTGSLITTTTKVMVIEE